MFLMKNDVYRSDSTTYIEYQLTFNFFQIAGCFPDEYECTDGDAITACIPDYKFCDTHIDCPNGTEEYPNCGKSIINIYILSPLT